MCWVCAEGQLFLFVTVYASWGAIENVCLLGLQLLDKQVSQFKQPLPDTNIIYIQYLAPPNITFTPSMNRKSTK